MIGSSSLLLILAVITALALWQLLAGIGKMRSARANPQDPQSPALARIGKIQAILGGLMLVLNILFNLPILPYLF